MRYSIPEIVYEWTILILKIVQYKKKRNLSNGFCKNFDQYSYADGFSLVTFKLDI